MASQSSTLEGGVASRAIDGNPDGIWANGSVTHTQLEGNPWWQVDLGASQDIHSIDLFNRTDCCGGRLSNYYVFVSDVPFTSTDPAATLGQAGIWSVFLREPAGAPTRISVGRSGRYVRVQLAGAGYLSVAEVRFNFEGLAPTATQSSTLEGGVASRAIDGNTDGHWANGSVTHTQLEPNAWWEVNLHRVQPIQQIEVWNRTDCCPERLSDYYVFVSDNPFASTDLAATLAQPGVWSVRMEPQAGTPTTIHVGRTGAYVRVQLAGTNHLSLAEVRIVLAPSAGAPFATQSSTHAGGVASLAIDDNTDGDWANGSVTHTESEQNAWWQVDLGSVRNISTVKIWNRSDCCPERLSDFHVFVSDVAFRSSDLAATLAQPGVDATRVAITAGRPTNVPVGRTGRFVRIQLSGTNYLSLAEVQIRGPQCNSNGVEDAQGACICDPGYGGASCAPLE